MTRSRIFAVPRHVHPRPAPFVAAPAASPSGRRSLSALGIRLGAALLALGVAGPAAADWSQIAYIPSNQVNVYYDRSSVVTEHGLTRAWFMLSYPRPMTSAEGFVFKSYKQLEVIDCKQRGSFTATFTAFSEADGGGRTIYIWNTANAVMPSLNPALPGSVRALMDGAACAPPPRPQHLPPVPPETASQATPPGPGSASTARGPVAQPGSPMPAATMPINTPSAPMGAPGQTTAKPLQ